jgi:phosphoglycerol transferase
MKRLQFLKPIINFYLVGLSILSMSRILLVLLFFNRVVEVENFWQLLVIGIRFDIIMLSYLGVLPAVLIAILPYSILNKIQPVIRYFLLICLCIVLFMELATPNFLMQYDTRPNRLFVEYLNHPVEVGSMLAKSLGWQILIIVLFLIFAIRLLFKKSKSWFVQYDTPYLKKLVFFPLVGFLLFFGIRSSLTSKRPINLSNAVFSENQFTNSLALNSLYTVSFAVYSLKHEGDMTKMYGSLKADVALKNVKKYMTANPEDFTDSDIPLLHKQLSKSKRDKPYNLVIFLQESLGAEYTGHLGGLPLTPNFDALSKKAMTFTNIYSTGTRSVRGIEAVVTGFPPTASRSVVKLSNAQNGFFTVADALKQRGYDTSFVYGGMANFDNMAGFFNGNGFDKIIDETDYDTSKAAFKGVWGYSDEDLVEKANNLYKSYESEEPFFSMLFSTSNHDPFEFPDGRVELYEQPKNTVNNAIKYADYAIGKFFDLAKKEAYYENTIFLIVADHNTRTYGDYLVPIHKFHIPAIILGPNVDPSIYSKLCSQIDLMPTVLDLMGLDVETPMPGRDLLKLPDSIPGRSIMQFHNVNAFRVGQEVVILQPKGKTVQYHLENDTTQIKKPVNKALEQDALSHIVLASKMYNDRSYRLPKNK